MNDISVDAITDILNSPDLMKNVQKILSGLSDNKSDETNLIPVSNSSEKSEPQLLEALEANGLLKSISSFLSQNKAERIALLTALRPFLSEEKRKILDSLLQILKVTNIFLASNTIK